MEDENSKLATINGDVVMRLPEQVLREFLYVTNEQMKDAAEREQYELAAEFRDLNRMTGDLLLGYDPDPNYHEYLYNWMKRFYSEFYLETVEDVGPVVTFVAPGITQTVAFVVSVEEEFDLMAIIDKMNKKNRNKR